MVSDLALRVANRWAAKARLRPGKHHYELDVGNWPDNKPEVTLEVRLRGRSMPPWVYGWIGAPSKPDASTEKDLRIWIKPEHPKPSEILTGRSGTPWYKQPWFGSSEKARSTLLQAGMSNGTSPTRLGEQPTE